MASHMLDFGRFGIKNIEQYDNIIGLDFGHGEVSAALWKMNGENVGDKPKDLKFNSNDKGKIYTALFISNDGMCKIGDEAINNKPGTGRLYTCFKVKPSRLIKNEPFENDTITKKELVQLFLREVIETLFLYNSEDLKGNNIILVGCPSSKEWLKNNGDVEYAKILSAKFKRQIPVIVMPESRASLIKTYREKKNAVSFHDGVIVFDFGSSTLDCTYINFKENYMNDDSEPLGASYIEEKMMESFLDDKYQKKNLKDEDFAKIDLRGKKETHYLAPNGEQMAVVQFTNGLPAKMIDEDYMHNITHNQKISYSTDAVLNNCGSWADLCEKFIRRVKNNFIVPFERKIQVPFKGLIILTGGASRMKFTEDICRKVFPNASFEADLSPSYCVSRGLAWAGKTDIEAQILLDETRKNIRIKISDAFNDLENSIADDISEIVFEFIRNKVEIWKEHGDSQTLQSLLDETKSEFKNYIASNKQVYDAVRKNFDTFLNGSKGLKTIIIETVNETFKDKYPNSVKEIKPFQIDADKWANITKQLMSTDKINISQSVLNNLKIENIVLLGLKFVLTLIVGILAMPLYILDGLFDTDMGDAFIDTFAPSWEENKNRTFPADKRRKMYTKMIEKKKNLLTAICNDIKESAMLKDEQEQITDIIMQNIDDDISEAINTISLHFSNH